MHLSVKFVLVGNVGGMTILLIPVALNLSPDRTLEERLNFDFWTFVNFAIHKCPYYGIGGGNSESALWEIGAGPRFLKLPPLLAAAAEISYSNTFQECSRKLVLSQNWTKSMQKLDILALVCTTMELHKITPLSQSYNNRTPVTKSGSFMAGAFKETLMGNMIATTVNLLPKPLSDLSF